MKCNYIEYHRLTEQMFYGTAQTDSHLNQYTEILRQYLINGGAKSGYNVSMELDKFFSDLKRMSVQYTVEDVERELGIFRTIQGPSKKDLEERKKMMKKYRIRREDLDN